MGKLASALERTFKSSNGNTLLYLNILAMGLAAAANTIAVVKDKNTNPEDKKFLVPAGIATGVANIGLYLALTKKIIKSMENSALNSIKEMEKNNTLVQKATDFANDTIRKAKNNIFKKNNPEHKQYVEDMKATLLSDGKATPFAINDFKNSLKDGASVVGAIAGVIISCGILTPVIRDVSAYFIQKKREKNNPDMKNKPYKPYFDPTHLKVQTDVTQKQPLNLTNYLAFTNRKTNGSMRV